ncbi:MAG: glutathione peroxidase [Bacteroidales bacterium]
MEKNIYAFSATSLKGKEIKLSDYEGKIILIVNTASKCGLTPQYKGLEELYNKYKDRGLVILGFPCNQFGKQEPGSESEISEGCLINYGVSFPMFSKIEVNGESAHPLFKYLKESLPGTFGNSIKWNFTKFLIGRDGKPIDRFSPITSPSRIESYIVELL